MEQSQKIVDHKQNMDKGAGNTFLHSKSADKVSDSNVTIYGFAFDATKCEVKKDGRTIFLTKKEFALLEFLFKNRGAMFTRRDLLCEIWSNALVAKWRTVDYHVKTLRKKLSDFGICIETIRCFGYRLK